MLTHVAFQNRVKMRNICRAMKKNDLTFLASQNLTLEDLNRDVKLDMLLEDQVAINLHCQSSIKLADLVIKYQLSEYLIWLINNYLQNLKVSHRVDLAAMTALYSLLRALCLEEKNECNEHLFTTTLSSMYTIFELTRSNNETFTSGDEFLNYNSLTQQITLDLNPLYELSLKNGAAYVNYLLGFYVKFRDINKSNFVLKLATPHMSLEKITEITTKLMLLQEDIYELENLTREIESVAKLSLSKAKQELKQIRTKLFIDIAALNKTGQVIYTRIAESNIYEVEHSLYLKEIDDQIKLARNKRNKIIVKLDHYKLKIAASRKHLQDNTEDDEEESNIIQPLKSSNSSSEACLPIAVCAHSVDGPSTKDVIPSEVNLQPKAKMVSRLSFIRKCLSDEPRPLASHTMREVEKGDLKTLRKKY